MTSDNLYFGEVVTPFAYLGTWCYVVRFQTGFDVHEFDNPDARLYDDSDADDPPHLFVYSELFLTPITP